MKAMINTQAKRRVLITAVMVTMIFTVNFAQGLLVEGATKLFKSILTKSETEAPALIYNADYSPSVETKGENLKFTSLKNFINRNNEMEATINASDFNPQVIKSFTVNSIDLAYEKELVAENWMTESFTSEIETAPAVESWMTESFSSEFETANLTESWMTEDLSENFETVLSSEEWMTESFYNEMETSIEVESWMLERIELTEMESEITLESWMTEPLYSSSEELIEVEDWMLQPLN